jgi:hypothetical protein
MFLGWPAAIERSVGVPKGQAVSLFAGVLRRMGGVKPVPAGAVNRPILRAGYAALGIAHAGDATTTVFTCFGPAKLHRNP